MKRQFLFLLAICLLTFPTIANAHPGRTDSNGGHYCRTNCDDWGVPWNEWHSHNAPAPTPEPEPAPTPAPTPEPEPAPEPAPAPVAQPVQQSSEPAPPVEEPQAEVQETTQTWEYNGVTYDTEEEMEDAKTADEEAEAEAKAEAKAKKKAEDEKEAKAAEAALEVEAEENEPVEDEDDGSALGGFLMLAILGGVGYWIYTRRQGGGEPQDEDSESSV